MKRFVLLGLIAAAGQAGAFEPKVFVPSEFVPSEFVPREFVPREFVPAADRAAQQGNRSGRGSGGSNVMVLPERESKYHTDEEVDRIVANERRRLDAENAQIARDNAERMRPRSGFNSSDGTRYEPAAGGHINTRTGEFMPAR